MAEYNGLLSSVSQFKPETPVRLALRAHLTIQQFYLVFYCKSTKHRTVTLYYIRPCYTKQFFLQLATQQTLRCKLQKHSRVTPHFATAIVVLRVARKVERPSTFRNVERQVACV